MKEKHSFQAPYLEWALPSKHSISRVNYTFEALSSMNYTFHTLYPEWKNISGNLSWVRDSFKQSILSEKYLPSKQSWLGNTFQTLHPKREIPSKHSILIEKYLPSTLFWVRNTFQALYPEWEISSKNSILSENTFQALYPEWKIPSKHSILSKKYLPSTLSWVKNTF